MESSYSDALAASIGVGAYVTYIVICLAMAVLVVIGYWKIFVKAGKPGWACIVPFYNLYCLYDIAWGNGWMFLLTFVPCVNFVISIILCIKLAKAYGKGAGFAIGLILLPGIFYLILGFGDSKYIGPQ